MGIRMPVTTALQYTIQYSLTKMEMEWGMNVINCPTVKNAPERDIDGDGYLDQWDLDGDGANAYFGGMLYASEERDRCRSDCAGVTLQDVTADPTLDYCFVLCDFELVGTEIECKCKSLGETYESVTEHWAAEVESLTLSGTMMYGGDVCDADLDGDNEIIDYPSHDEVNGSDPKDNGPSTDTIMDAPVGDCAGFRLDALSGQ